VYFKELYEKEKIQNVG
jgi:hypothetical protein